MFYTIVYTKNIKKVQSEQILPYYTSVSKRYIGTLKILQARPLDIPRTEHGITLWQKASPQHYPVIIVETCNSSTKPVFSNNFKT